MSILWNPVLVVLLDMEVPMLVLSCPVSGCPNIREFKGIVNGRRKYRARCERHRKTDLDCRLVHAQAGLASRSVERSAVLAAHTLRIRQSSMFFDP
jgi:hypothetical protein